MKKDFIGLFMHLVYLFCTNTEKKRDIERADDGRK